MGHEIEVIEVCFVALQPFGPKEIYSGEHLFPIETWQYDLVTFLTMCSAPVGYR